MEWDEHKSQINIKKHGLSFEEAQEVFNDPNSLEYYDKEHSSSEEDRYICYGDIGNCLIVVVVYREREGKTRLISARFADKDEEAYYYEHIT